jgi:hypothetical protein
MLIGRHFDDAALLRLGFAYEQSVDWQRFDAVCKQSSKRWQRWLIQGIISNAASTLWTP